MPRRIISATIAVTFAGVISAGLALICGRGREKGRLPMAKIADPFKQEKQIVANYLINYHDIKQQYEHDRERILENSPPPADGMPRGSTTGNRTASAGIALAGLAVTEKWLQVIKVLVAGLSDDDKLLLELKQTHREYVRGNSVKKLIVMELGVSMRTVYNRWQGILEQGRELAVRRGLLR